VRYETYYKASLFFILYQVMGPKYGLLKFGKFRFERYKIRHVKFLHNNNSNTNNNKY